MSTLQAIPTQHGIDILNSELKNTVTKYRLLGALTHDAPSESLYSFYENTIETSYYDDNGVLTFILNLPIEHNFDEYLHQIYVLDSSNQSVIECSTPKVALPKGIGGMVTLKAAISGEAGQVIFKHSEFVTETELKERFLNKTLKHARLYPDDITMSLLPIAEIPKPEWILPTSASKVKFINVQTRVITSEPICLGFIIYCHDSESGGTDYPSAKTMMYFSVPNFPTNNGVYNNFIVPITLQDGSTPKRLSFATSSYGPHSSVVSKFEVKIDDVWRSA
ncbi:hypothetical protein [Vibrio crassostreae]|uniref:hypothetical protein n=1 Tax=Vibrio crassostreae TaxID=246167 RepID=UPI001B302C03|nr:hypothetical protein [Vibrio crassostreae]CAK1707086.1 hypothetical protein VCRA2118O41_100145 [Vibrio crassostreae]CAK2384365.1 hypothetical protein VCRA2116O372_70048 [Vibrio crassostreae]CAK2444778.1 hypothetical protein VCRA2111O136_10243 [Vibrio crassostreae]CAK2555722.1 hypothetical protein VCRA2116O374_60146 [Vibrio crassostreae]CAK2561944.1 hypothetical protein VCRA2117O377_70146 [Vibrio crassostreae]